MGVHLRNLKVSDFRCIDRIWKRFWSDRYSLPSVCEIVDDKTIEKDGKVIGYGVIKLWAEGIIVLDQAQPVVTRAKAVRIAIDHALDSVREHKLETLYIATDDPHYIEVLKKHWGFREVKETVLRVEVK